MKQKKQIAVSKRGLLQRINRRLAKEDYGDRVFAARGERAKADLGDFYRIDLEKNAVVDTHVDLEELARELEVLAAWEALEKEEAQ